MKGHKKTPTRATTKGKAVRSPLFIDDAEMKAAMSAVGARHQVALAEVQRSPAMMAEVHAILAHEPARNDAVFIPWMRDGAQMSFVDFATELLELRLTVGQRTLSRVVFDGVDPCDLVDAEERRIADEMFGGVQRIPPAARGLFVVLRLGRGSGKTTVCGAYAVYRMCTADVSRCGPGDKAAVIVIAPDADIAGETIARGQAFTESPAIAPFVSRMTRDGFFLRRPQDGKTVRFIVRARSRKAGRGFSAIEIIIDESEFVASSSKESIITDKDIIGGATARLEPGARINLVSTPWPAPSETSEMFAANFGQPSSAICALASTPVMRDNDPHVLSMIEALRLQSPATAQREFFCVLEDGAGGAFFEMTTVRTATVDAPFVAKNAMASTGIDPAFVHDSSAIAIVERDSHPRGGVMLNLVHLDLITPTKERPLVPSDVIRDFAATARLHGCSLLATDSHRVGTVRSNAALVGVQVYDRGETKATMVYLRDVFREGRLRIPDDPRLIMQLKGFTFRAMSGGDIKIDSPRSKDGGHGDLVSALAQAVNLDCVQYGTIVQDTASASAAPARAATASTSFGGGFTASGGSAPRAAAAGASAGVIPRGTRGGYSW